MSLDSHQDALYHISSLLVPDEVDVMGETVLLDEIPNLGHLLPLVAICDVDHSMTLVVLPKQRMQDVLVRILFFRVSISVDNSTNWKFFGKLRYRILLFHLIPFLLLNILSPQHVRVLHLEVVIGVLKILKFRHGLPLAERLSPLQMFFFFLFDDLLDLRVEGWRWDFKYVSLCIFLVLLWVWHGLLLLPLIFDILVLKQF